ncbi:MAG: hypothetical protein ACOCP8_03130 [archaeon]
MKRLSKNINKNMLSMSRKEFIEYISKKAKWSKKAVENKLNNIYNGIANKDEKLTRMVFIDYMIPRGLMFSE